MIANAVYPIISFHAFMLLLALLYVIIAGITTYLGFKVHFVIGLAETGFWTFLTGIILVVLL
jgi:hypothetical protein